MSSHPVIQVLPTQVAEKIAAGEVVERPSSAVKELVENSLDAGATEVFVRLIAGGKSLIEVLDNGSGMEAGDLEKSILRHATSKLRDFSGLESLRTLGFRGEALPSIAAVSDLSILSRSKNSKECHEIRSPHYKSTVATYGHFLGSTHGTRVRAADLFSQMPARQKFLKSEMSETSAVREWLERIAVSHPETGFQLEGNGKVYLSYRPQSEAERVGNFLSGQGAGRGPLISESEEFPDGSRLRIHWLQGLSLPQSKKLVQVVNGRVLRDRLLQQATMQAFRQSLLPGQYPAIALFYDIDPSELDVNVHPAKTEIRFLDSQTVFSRVHRLIDRMLTQKGFVGYAQPVSSGTQAYLSAPNEMRHSTYTFEIPQELPLSPHPSRPSHPYADRPYLGILFRTYLLFDFGDELAMIDQHAAHERIRFEVLKTRWLTNGEKESQSLLMPEVISFPADQLDLALKRIPFLARLGFDAEVFGENSVLFRSVPAGWGSGGVTERLNSLLTRTLALSDQEASTELPFDEKVFEKLASEACHSAIRAGDELESIEAKALVDRLFECAHPWNCPHGRPTTARVPRARFEEWFFRRAPA